MKPLHLVAGGICTLFGIMELFKELDSMLGLLLIFAGLLLFSTARKRRSDAFYDDGLYDGNDFEGNDFDGWDGGGGD